MKLQPLHHIKRFNTTVKLAGKPHSAINSVAFQSLVSSRDNLVALTEARLDAPEQVGSVIQFEEESGSASVSTQHFDLMVPRGMRRIQALTNGEPAYWGGQSKQEANLVQMAPDSDAEIAWLELATHLITPQAGIDREALPTPYYGGCTNGASSCSCPLQINLLVDDGAPLQTFLVEWDYEHYLQYDKFKSQLQSIPYFKNREATSVQMVPCILSSGTIFWTPIRSGQRDEINTFLKGTQSQDLKFDRPLQLLEHAGILMSGEDSLYPCAG